MSNPHPLFPSIAPGSHLYRCLCLTTRNFLRVAGEFIENSWPFSMLVTERGGSCMKEGHKL
jgi:hypothetical protein